MGRNGSAATARSRKVEGFKRTDILVNVRWLAKTRQGELGWQRPRAREEGGHGGQTSLQSRIPLCIAPVVYLKKSGP